MVMPPDVTGTNEPGSPSGAVPPASVESCGIAVGANGFPSPSQDAHGEKLAKISLPTMLKSSSSEVNFIAWSLLRNLHHNRFAVPEKRTVTRLHRSPPISGSSALPERFQQVI